MATTKSLGQKDSFDKFYTVSEVAQYCISLVGDLSKFDLIVEPSAGDGAFSNLLPEGTVAIDIAPENETIEKKDFFEYQPEGKHILVIGNPPFGQQATSAISFFNHAAEFAEVIAFILPRSFRKNSIQNRLSLNFILEKDELLPKNAFLLNGKPYDVPCVFQIWRRSIRPRQKVKLKTTSEYIKFTSNPAEADFRIQRVGGNAGKLFEDKNGATASNHYIINTSKFSTPELIEICKSLSYPSIEDTVGPKSLPKSELVEVLEEKIKSM